MSVRTERMPIVTLRAILLGACLASSGVAAAAAQRQPPPAPSAPAAGEPAAQPEISAGEIQRLYDAYALVQAQEALQLSDDQYVRFVTRLKALQETRRRHQQARNQILQDLRRLTNPQTGTGDEASIRERLTALRAEDERSVLELRKAVDALDEGLDARQQARFRLFEERMEQRKLDLLMRARQNARNPARRPR
jgi:hypothetical protein